jgi:fibronectin-binding autotransporter adhesin
LEPIEPKVLLTTTLYWNPISNHNWNTSDANWNTAFDDSGCQQAWSDGDSAYFAASGSTVTISGAIDVHAISFYASGYTVANAAGATLTIEQEVFFNDDATISAPITGAGFAANGLTGGVTLTLSGANTYSGDTDVSGGGQVQFTGSALTALPNVDLTWTRMAGER